MAYLVVFGIFVLAGNLGDVTHGFDTQHAFQR